MSPKITYQALAGRVVKHIRIEQNMAQARMAVNLGLSQSAYSRLETGDSTFNITQFRLCANALGMLPSQLLQSVEFFESQLRLQSVSIAGDRKVSPEAAAQGVGALLALLTRGLPQHS
jgi:transcriptional regulator with XRE-family HTH domain